MIDPTASVMADVTLPTAKLPCLVVVAGRDQGRVIPIESGERIVGRGKRADVQIEDQGVSRRHAMLSRSAGKVEMRDLGSTNGCWCNGRQVATAMLKDGDCLQLGACRLSFRLSTREEDRLLRKLYSRATRDGLTGLFNRASLQDRLDREVYRQQRYQRGLALLQLDLDHFKRVNDTHGHAAGDRVLAAFGRIIRDSLRGCDLAARTGGEEFVVVLPEADARRAAFIAEKIRKRVAGMRVKLPRGKPVSVSVSIGIALAPDKPESALPLLEAADKACYRAKKGGRNRVSR